MRDPQALVGTQALALMLAKPEVRVYDCTTYLEPAEPGSDLPYKVVPGRATFEAGHIPGADFLDIQGELSDTSTGLRFMMPSPEHLAAALGRHGIGPDVRVVLYSIGTMQWATRVWWMLRALGYDKAAILDGGLDTWKAEGRPIETGAPRGYAPTRFVARPRPGYFVGKDAVLAARGDPGTVVVNALSPELHQGLTPSRYGRPGRIPGSVNVSAATLYQPGAKTLTSLDDARAKLAAQGVTPDKSVICYCGGGISATVDLFLMHQLGFDRLALYDASMGEWARDPALPIETG